MRIISYNVNGIRSAVSKGFLEWLQTEPAEVICLQEIKAQATDIPIATIEQLGYHTYLFPAQKKGYSGVAILSKTKPNEIYYGNGYEQSDFEGRLIMAAYGDVAVINCYFPSGTTGELRQAYKYQWLDELMTYLVVLKKSKKQIILCGDYNIAHKPIDIHDPIGNKKSSGFLPEERAWMDSFFASGFTDTFRALNATTTDAYSWWSFRAASRARNKGWRIDYISCTNNLAKYLTEAKILPEVQHSDHCPVYAAFTF